MPATLEVRLIRQLSERLRRVACFIARRARTVEIDDLVQIGLEAAVRAAPSYRVGTRASLSTFLHIRGRGAMLDACKRLKLLARVELKDDMLVSESAEEIAIAEGERVDRCGILLAGLAAMKPSDREIALACAIRGESITDVARRLGLGYGAAWRRQARALMRLQSLVDTHRAEDH